MASYMQYDKFLEAWDNGNSIITKVAGQWWCQKICRMMVEKNVQDYDGRIKGITKISVVEHGRQRQKWWYRNIKTNRNMEGIIISGVKTEVETHGK